MAAISSASFHACSRIQSFAFEGPPLPLFMERHFQGEPGAVGHASHIPRTAPRVPVAQLCHTGDEATGVTLGLDFVYGALYREFRAAPPIEVGYEGGSHALCTLTPEPGPSHPPEHFDAEPGSIVFGHQPD